MAMGRLWQRGFPKAAFQVAKKIHFGMSEYYLEPTHRRSVVFPIPIRTKFSDYTPYVGIIFRSAWLRVLADPVLSRYFPTSPFPVWINHRNLKSVLSYKHKIFEEDHTNWEYKDFESQKFNRPKPRKYLNAM